MATSKLPSSGLFQLVVFLATRNTVAIGMVKNKSTGKPFLSFYLGRYYFIAEVLPVSHKPYDPTVCISKHDKSTNAVKGQAHYLSSKGNAQEQHMNAQKEHDFCGFLLMVTNGNTQSSYKCVQHQSRNSLLGIQLLCDVAISSGALLLKSYRKSHRGPQEQSFSCQETKYAFLLIDIFKV